MKTELSPRLVNHPFGDPGLIVLLRWQGRALQFDLGRLGRTDPADLLRITHVFVSHAHMDHFMGFDHLLRLFLHRDARLEIFGPEGFLDRLAGRLAGYTWNLTEDYPLEIVGHELHEAGMRRARYRAATSFEPEALAEIHAAPAGDAPRTLVEEEHIRVDAAILDHKIPCLAFALTEKDRLNVDATKLAERRLRPGPWLEDLKQAIARGAGDETQVVVAGTHASDAPVRVIPLGEIRDLVLTSRGQKIGYVVDTLYNDANRRRIVELVRGADVFFCEAPFLDVDEDQATKRHHLTARQAGLLGREAAVHRLEVFHFSPRYEGRGEEIYAEARAAFRGSD